MSIDILLEEVHSRLFGELGQNEARAVFFCIQDEHVIFNEFFLEFHEVVDNEVLIGFIVLSAVLLVGDFEVVIAKEVPAFGVRDGVDVKAG